MANPGERIMRANCTEDSVFVELADGRTVSAPVAWYPRLLHATPQQRSNCVIAGAGYGAVQCAVQLYRPLCLVAPDRNDPCENECGKGPCRTDQRNDTG